MQVRHDVQADGLQRVRQHFNTDQATLTKLSNDKGWHADANQLLQCVIEQAGYTSSEEHNNVDTLVVAVGSDKCPFLHK